MILYHVGFNEIKDVDLKRGRANADFGQGFYLAPDSEFSLKWATFRNDSKTYLNKYELDLDRLNVKTFEKNEEWFDYIYKNRNGFKDDLKEYDVIIGPIANDILYNILGVTTSGMLDKNISFKLLMIGKEYLQIVIKSELAKENLKFIESQILNEKDVLKLKKELKKEEKNYQKNVFKILNKLS